MSRNTKLLYVFFGGGVFRCAQLNTRVTKLSQELKEEQEMNHCLRANQTQLQTRLSEEERKGKENGESVGGKR